MLLLLLPWALSLARHDIDRPQLRLPEPVRAMT